MKWAFIDYENIGTLAKIDMPSYEKVTVFMGAKQPRLEFGDKKYDFPINLQIVQIKATQENNLDFHLAYYLGKSNSEAPSGVQFEVISNDNGFAPLLAHLKQNGRPCKQIKIETASSEKAVLMQSLKQRSKEKRPKKVSSLRNHIASHLRIKGNEVKIQNFLNQLVNDKFVQIDGEKIEYTS